MPDRTGARLDVEAPAGFDAFVHDVSDATSADGSPDHAALVALAIEHGIEILGPGPTVP